MQRHDHLRHHRCHEVLRDPALHHRHRAQQARVYRPAHLADPRDEGRRGQGPAHALPAGRRENARRDLHRPRSAAGRPFRQAGPACRCRLRHHERDLCVHAGQVPQDRHSSGVEARHRRGRCHRQAPEHRGAHRHAVPRRDRSLRRHQRGCRAGQDHFRRPDDGCRRPQCRFPGAQAEQRPAAVQQAGCRPA